MFTSVPAYPGDPILSLQQDYSRDSRADRSNLSIGLYYDQDGRVPVLGSVRAARAALEGGEPAPGYLPMGGDPLYCASAAALVFGAASSALRSGRVATIQTLGGSGALKVGADFLHDLYPRSGVWVSAPTWDNHLAIFEGAGFEVCSYPYFDPVDNAVAFEQMLACLSALPPESIVVLHPCCHNPTGADLTPGQWDAVIAVAASRHLIPFMDMAYQGLGAGIDEDRYAIRAMAVAGVPFLVSHSFSKIFSMYSERCGTLSVVCETAPEASRVHGQLQRVVRRNYSSPPAAGARVIAQVLADAGLRAVWRLEVQGMRERIDGMRVALHQAATKASDARDWSFLLRQRGLFSYAPGLGASARALREQDGIYILESGRICMAGLTPANVDKVAGAFARASRV